jgi:hypothetical protein
MPEDDSGNDDVVAANSGGAMRIFIFKSDVSPRLRAFGGDLVGSQLPKQFSPWHVIGAIAPDRQPPYRLSRQVIETAINDCGFQLWRTTKKTAESA